MRKSVIMLILISLILVFFCQNLYAADDDIPGIINTQEDARKVLDKAKRVLKQKLGMTFRYPVVVEMVTGRKLDELAKGSPYKGAIVGLYTFQKGKHHVYMMKDVARDSFYGSMCHEMTHGWQVENCPGQSIVLKEGLAVWVNYKVWIWDGAYTSARKLNQYIADPVYGVGYRFIQKLEDKYGEKSVLDVVKKLKNIPPDF